MAIVTDLQAVSFIASKKNIEAMFPHLVDSLLSFLDEESPDEETRRHIVDFKLHNFLEFLSANIFVPRKHTFDSFGNSLNWLDDWKRFFFVDVCLVYCWTLLRGNKEEIAFYLSREPNGSTVFLAENSGFYLTEKDLNRMNQIFRSQIGFFIAIGPIRYGVQLRRVIL